MFSNSKIALAATLILGAASAALANDVETNPSEAQSAREWAQFLGQNQKHRPSPGCDHVYSYDRANYAYSYDLACSGYGHSSGGK
jgi:hypothetical protein